MNITRALEEPSEEREAILRRLLHSVGQGAFFEPNFRYEFGCNITIGVHINQGITIGDNTIIGSGSVLTKDIPANVIAAGVPCRVIREITEADNTGFQV